MDDEVVSVGQLSERADIVRQIDCCRCGQSAARRHMGVDVVRLDVNAVTVGFIPQLYIERENANVISFD